MRGYNKWIVIGNLGADPELKYTQSGKAVATFSLAVNSKYGDTERTEWVNCTAWEKAAETIHEWAKKGMPLLVEGRSETNEWEDKNSGEKKKAVRLIVGTFLLLGGKEQRVDPGGEPDSRTGMYDTKTGAPAQAQGGDEDELPF